MRIKYSGQLGTLEVTTTAAWVSIPVANPAWVQRFGDHISAGIDLTSGDQLPYRLALLSILRDAWINNRPVEIYITLGGWIPIPTPVQPIPPPVPAPEWEGWVDDANFPFAKVPAANTCIMSFACERVIVKTSLK